MENGNTTGRDAAARQARFGALPERTRFEDMVEEHPADPAGRLRQAYAPEGAWMSSSCLALDLGL